MKSSNYVFTSEIIELGIEELRSILQITTSQLACLNQTRDDLDDLVYHVPARRQEVAEKLGIVNRKIREKLAEARRLILCIEFGCNICHPDQGVAYE